MSATLHRIARALLALHLTSQGVPQDTAQALIATIKED